jgi:hypothetical protein
LEVYNIKLTERERRERGARECREILEKGQHKTIFIYR